MSNRLDLLPEELIQLIWKWVHKDCLSGIILEHLIFNTINDFYITTRIIKRRGHYYDILKDKYNVTLFSKSKTYFCNLKWYDLWLNKKQEKMFVSWHINRLKEDLVKILVLNGYEYPEKKKIVGGLQGFSSPTRKYMYKSWTKKRIIKEIMSL